MEKEEDEALLKALDLFSPPRESPSLAAARIRALLAERDALADKALRFDLDQAGIAARERESVDLVELRADLARANARAEAWKKAMLSVSWHSASCDCPLCVNAQAALAAARRLDEGK